jgi:hypothetical protein
MTLIVPPSWQSFFSKAPLPELKAELVHTDADWPNEIRITDPADSNQLRIRLWRTVRVPNNGQVYDLPAGFGKFPLLDAKPFNEMLTKDKSLSADILFPMYDREAMYIEILARKYEFSSTYSQRPWAVRPFVGRINAITGNAMSSTDSTEMRGLDQTMTRISLGEASSDIYKRPPPPDQDYIVASIGLSDIHVKPQWLDGIAIAPGRVKQFVAVPFGSGESIESQKTGHDHFGGIQLEIIPSFPMSHLRHPLSGMKRLFIKDLSGKQIEMMIDYGALVWDLVYKYAQLIFGMQNPPHMNFYFVFAGKALEPLGSLTYYNVQHSSVLLCILKLRGGGSTDSIPPPPKKMAMGAGGSISQNVEKDRQDPVIWDFSRAKMINIQIINSIDFEKFTGLIAPPSPIDFETYTALKIPFFHYYTEDMEAVGGNFSDVSSVSSKVENNVSISKGVPGSGALWTKTPEQCNSCQDNAPRRL